MHKIPDIEPFKQKLSSLDEQMAAADFFSDAKKATEVSREHQRLSSLIEKFEQYHKVEQQLIEVAIDLTNVFIKTVQMYSI